MKNYYPVAEQLYNEGGLTLVSKQFIPWVKALVVAVNNNINEDKIWEKKARVMKEAVKIVSNSFGIKKLFREALVSVSAVDEDVVSKVHFD